MRNRLVKTDSAAADEKSSTFNARLPLRVKNALQRAADIRGQSLSDFVLSSAYDRAVATISAAEVVRLSAAGSVKFAEALLEEVHAEPDVVARFVRAHRKSQYQE